MKPGGVLRAPSAAARRRGSRASGARARALFRRVGVGGADLADAAGAAVGGRAAAFGLPLEERGERFEVRRWAARTATAQAAHPALGLRGPAHTRPLAARTAP